MWAVAEIKPTTSRSNPSVCNCAMEVIEIIFKDKLSRLAISYVLAQGGSGIIYLLQCHRNYHTSTYVLLR